MSNIHGEKRTPPSKWPIDYLTCWDTPYLVASKDAPSLSSPLSKDSKRPLETVIEGWKVVDAKMCGWGGFLYEVGKSYVWDSPEIELCERGFHFGTEPLACLFWSQHLTALPLRWLRVRARGGLIITDCKKSVCGDLEIVEEVTDRRHIAELQNGTLELPSSWVSQRDWSVARVTYIDGCIRQQTFE